jgi:hypothetical protein
MSRYSAQKDFIQEYVEKIAKARKTTAKKSRREQLYQYFLQDNTSKSMRLQNVLKNSEYRKRKKLFPIH